MNTQTNALSSISYLKLACFTLLLSNIYLTHSLNKSTIKEPLILDLSSQKTALKITPQDSNKRSSAEIKTFLKKALYARFVQPDSTFLSPELHSLSKKENNILSSKNVIASIDLNPNEIQLANSNSANILFTKIYRIENKMATASLSLYKAQFSRIKRNPKNPYGLVLTRLTPVKISEKN